jgi:hypothetical protein
MVGHHRGMPTPRGSISELLQGPAVISIVRAGEYLGLKRSASYEAAKTGAIPTIPISPGKRVVPTARFAQMLGAPSAYYEDPIVCLTGYRFEGGVVPDADVHDPSR